PDASRQTDADRAHRAAGDEALRRIGEHLDAFRFKAGLEEMMSYARACNQHFSERAPWASRKTDMGDCAAALATCLHAAHYLAIMCQPFMPHTAASILAQLNRPQAGFAWRAPAPLPAGAPLGEPRILFRKIEPPREPQAPA